MVLGAAAARLRARRNHGDLVRSVLKEVNVARIHAVRLAG